MAGAAGKGGGRGFYSGRHTKVAAKFMAVAEPPSLQPWQVASELQVPAGKRKQERKRGGEEVRKRHNHWS